MATTTRCAPLRPSERPHGSVSDVHEGAKWGESIGDDRADRIASGVEVGGYQVEELIDARHGEVYRHDGRLDRNVALKILAPRYVETSDFASAFSASRGLLRASIIPNVVPVYDAGGRCRLLPRDALRRGQTCAWCFDVKACSLQRGRSRSSRRSPMRSTLLMRRISSIAMSSRRTFCIDERGHCYLAASATQSVADRGQITDGSLLGTIDYVAPEQIRGDEVDGARMSMRSAACCSSVLSARVPSALFRGRHHLRSPRRGSAIHVGASPATDRYRPRVPAVMAKEPSERNASCASS